MIRFARLLFFAALAIASPVYGVSDEEVNAHKVAFDVAGAFSNDGFKLRDGNCSGSIRAKQGIFVQVNLYAGNQYWFCAGATEKAKKLLVTVFDENGQPVESEPYQDGAKAAAGFSPTSSGAYIIRIEEVEGDPASYCLLYCYK